MTEYIEHACDIVGFEQAAKQCFLSCYEKLAKDRVLSARLTDIISGYEKTDGADFETASAFAENAEERTGVCRFTVMMLIMLCFSKHLKELYDEQGLSGGMFCDIMRDLRCKNAECFKIHGVYGSFVAQWEFKIFNMKIFGMGRLQFEPKILDGDFLLKDRVVKAGSRVIGVHIPSSGRLDIGECLKAFDAARGFFGKDTVFHCDSWLLYPKNREFITPPSNILKFAELFEVTGCRESKSDLWRIFGTLSVDDIAALPEDTSLQRDFKRRLLSGKSVGQGYGFRFK